MGMNVGPGTGIREDLVSSACASEWSRSSLVTLDSCQHEVYIRDCGLAPRWTVILIIIIINLILSSISIRPGVALSLKNLLIQHSLLYPTNL